MDVKCEEPVGSALVALDKFSGCDVVSFDHSVAGSGENVPVAGRQLKGCVFEVVIEILGMSLDGKPFLHIRGGPIFRSGLLGIPNAMGAAFPGGEEGVRLGVEDHVIDAKPTSVGFILTGVSGVGREELTGHGLVDFDGHVLA